MAGYEPSLCLFLHTKFIQSKSVIPCLNTLDIEFQIIMTYVRHKWHLNNLSEDTHITDQNSSQTLVMVRLKKNTLVLSNTWHILNELNQSEQPKQRTTSKCAPTFLFLALSTSNQ